MMTDKKDTLIHGGDRQSFLEKFGREPLDFSANVSPLGVPETVRKYLGLTLLPHSGVSLVFTGIICQTLASAPQLAQIVQGTIAAAAVINEIIAVIAAREGFRMAGEISRNGRKAEANG